MTIGACRAHRAPSWLAGAAALLGWAAAGPPARVAAQVPLAPAPALTLVGGAYDLDADSAEVGGFVGLRFDFPLGRWSVLEASGERAAYDRARRRQVRWIADFALRAEWPGGRLHPYAGVSLGAKVDFQDDRPPSQDFVGALYGVLGGVRADLTPHLGVRGEVRVRWLDRLEDRIGLYAAGVSWRF